MAKNQKGFLLPLAVFIIVVMGVFALVLSRNTIQSNTSATQEFITTQAFYAADSGAQRGMQKLFFSDANKRQDVDQRCSDISKTSSGTPLVLNFSASTANDIPGLNGCSISVSCACAFGDGNTCIPITASNYDTGAPINRQSTFYTLTSVATCGAATLRSVRTIEVGSFMRQE